MLTALPPIVRIENFLGEMSATQLLDYAIAHEADFTPSALNRKGKSVVDRAARKSMISTRLDRFADVIENGVTNALDSVLRQLKINNLLAHSYELEMVWHGDGGFFKRHIDMVCEEEPSSRRLVSMVYYFHRKPKAFTGGQLRLYPLATDSESYHDVEPCSDSALFFPSWFPHEVRPVHCRSRIFGDGRFAINCWVRKGLIQRVR
jgi:SM-20-related protein